MEVETISLINTLISRINRLEMDMIAVKKQQSGHDNQIDALALEVHEFRQEFDAFRQHATDKFASIDQEFKKVHQQIRSLHTRMDNGFGEVKDELKEVKDGLKLVMTALGV